MGAVFGGAEIRFAEIVEQGGGDEKPAFLKGHLLGADVHELDERVEQKLEGGQGAACAQHFLREGGCEIAACAVARHGQAVRVDVQLVGAVYDPAPCGVCVFVCGGEFVFWGEAVVDRNDAGAGGVGQATGDHVVAVEIADDEAAAVEIDHGWPCAEASAKRGVEAGRARTGTAIDDERGDIGELWRIAFDGAAGAEEAGAQALGDLLGGKT